MTSIFLSNIVPFLLIISFIVFIHEMGHYLVAKYFKVKVESFSIGFGKEIIGWNDKSGTRWKISMIPLGGYVKMFGDNGVASEPSPELQSLSSEDKDKTFFYKKTYQKSLIVFAGPFANFILTLVVFTCLFSYYGITKVSPVIGEVISNSAAYEAGLKAGDKIVEIDGKNIKTFADIEIFMSINRSKEIKMLIEREGEVINKSVYPKFITTKNDFGDKIEKSFLGIKSSTNFEYQKLSLSDALIYSIRHSYDITITSFKALGQIITGQRNFSDMSGPIGIAKYSGDITKDAMNKEKYGSIQPQMILYFIAIISLSVGIFNLLPIPVLDGGHLFLYFVNFATKIISGKKVSEKFIFSYYQAGLIMVISLFILISLNDMLKILSLN